VVSTALIVLGKSAGLEMQLQYAEPARRR